MEVGALLCHAGIACAKCANKSCACWPTPYIASLQTCTPLHLMAACMCPRAGVAIHFTEEHPKKKEAAEVCAATEKGSHRSR